MAFGRRTQKGRRYWKYRGAHFAPEEARELAKLRRLDYREIAIMVRERRTQWSDFVVEAVAGKWSSAHSRRVWRKRIKDWYVEKEYTQQDFAWWKKFPTANVWFWFDDVAGRLPVEQRYSNVSPSARKKGRSLVQRYSEATKTKGKVEGQRWVDQLMKTVAHDPARDKELTAQAHRLGFKGKSLYKTAQRRKMV